MFIQIELGKHDDNSNNYKGLPLNFKLNEQHLQPRGIYNRMLRCKYMYKCMMRQDGFLDINCH